MDTLQNLTPEERDNFARIMNAIPCSNCPIDEEYCNTACEKFRDYIQEV